jgi:hypothetical protein
MLKMKKVKGSIAFRFTGADWHKIGVGAGVAFAGAVVAFLPQAFTGVHFTAEVGGQVIDYTVFVGFAASVLVNTLRKWITDHSQ